MEQRRGVDELYDRRGANVLLAFVAQRPRGEEYDQGAQPLAATHYYVFGYLGDEGYVAFEAAADKPVHGPHVVVGESRNFIEAGRIRIYCHCVHKCVILPESRAVGEIGVYIVRHKPGCKPLKCGTIPSRPDVDPERRNL